MVILYKKVCKNIISRGHILVFLKIILQFSLRPIVQLEQKIV